MRQPLSVEALTGCNWRSRQLVGLVVFCTAATVLWTKTVEQIFDLSSEANEQLAPIAFDPDGLGDKLPPPLDNASRELGLCRQASQTTFDVHAAVHAMGWQLVAAGVYLFGHPQQECYTRLSAHDHMQAIKLARRFGCCAEPSRLPFPLRSSLAPPTL